MHKPKPEMVRVYGSLPILNVFYPETLSPTQEMRTADLPLKRALEAFVV